MKENRLVYQVPGGSPSTSPEGLSEDFEIYTVQSGDTLVGILKGQYGEYPSSIFLDKIAKWNNIKKIKLENGKFDYPLSIDQKIKLPRLENKSPIKFEVNSVLVAEKAEKGYTKAKDIYRKKLDTYSFGSLEKQKGYTEAKENLSKALAFIETNVTLKNGNKFKLSYEPSWYLALLAKESYFDPNVVNKSSGATGYFQMFPKAVQDVKKKYAATPSDAIKWSDVDYKTNPIANCVYGILYLELLYQNISSTANTEYINFPDKNKLAFYAYNKGATNLKRTFKDCPKPPKNFNDFEVMIAKKIENKFNNIESFKKEIKSIEDVQSLLPDMGLFENYFQDYKASYYLDYLIPNSFVAINKILNNNSDELEKKMDVKYFDESSKYKDIKLTYANVREMVEYYRIIESMALGKTLRQDEYYEKTGFHIVLQNENLDQIAKKYSVSSVLLARNNNLNKGDKIYDGQKLKIPKEVVDSPNVEL